MIQRINTTNRPVQRKTGPRTFYGVPLDAGTIGLLLMAAALLAFIVFCGVQFTSS